MNLKKKQLYSCFIILFLFFGSSNLAFATPNSNNTDVINENLEKYNTLDNETLEINSEITKLNQKIEELNINLTDKENEIAITEIEIETTNKKIDETQKDLSKKEELMEDRIRVMYKTDLTTSFISYIISSDNIFELISRATSIKQIISADRNIISEINEKKVSLLEDKQLIENKKSELLNLKSSIETDLNEVESKKTELETLVKELDKKKSELMKTIEENELKLISNSINIINSDSSSIADLTDALNSLNSLLPQLNTDSAINSTNVAIEKATNQISILEEELKTSSNMEIADENNSLEQEPSINSSTTIENSKATYSMVATAYTGGSLTAMGLKPVRDPNGISTIAVDPSVIPLGSKVYVEGYGIAIASDTGGAIKGNKIDIYLNSLSECISFGRQTVTVSVLAYPNEW